MVEQAQSDDWRCKEVEQHCGQLTWCLFRHMVAAIDRRTANVVGPSVSRSRRGRRREARYRRPAPRRSRWGTRSWCRAFGRLRRLPGVDSRGWPGSPRASRAQPAGHARQPRGPANASLPITPLGHAIPRGWIGVDDALGGLVHLREEEPVPPTRGEPPVGTLEPPSQRHPLQQAESRYRLRMVRVPDDRRRRSSRSCPTSPKLRCPSRCISRRTSPAIARFRVGRVVRAVSAGCEEPPVATQVPDTQRCGAAPARSRDSCALKVACVRGCPCSKTTGRLRLPPYRTRMTASPRSHIGPSLTPRERNPSLLQGAYVRTPAPWGGTTGKGAQAIARASRILHERRRLGVAARPPDRARVRAPTTRSFRGRKSSIVRPSRYCSITAGLTYEDLATAGVLPRRRPTVRITAAIRRVASPSAGGPCSANAMAAMSVPPQVRKSFAVNSWPS